MADLEAVLADVSYLMAMEKSKTTSSNRRFALPDPSIRSVMKKYFEERGQLNFNWIFDQEFGYSLFQDYCTTIDSPPQMSFFEAIKTYRNTDSEEERGEQAKDIFDKYIMRELLASSHDFTKTAVNKVREVLREKKHPVDLFDIYLDEIRNCLSTLFFEGFVKSKQFSRFCQWKNLELSLHLSMNDFSVHRIIGRGGFGEVYGCRKADTGSMYAMKCLDKKRIKLKQGEALALNERVVLQMVDSPFIVCMTYAFQTADKVCFVLDLMNGGDLHYHLTQHGMFSEDEVRFYAVEIMLGIEHMHSRNIVYRDLKPANILLDEKGHTKISDLGLACDISKKKPHASVGTHGYMAPEVLSRNVSYGLPSDWFSYGCTLYKLLRGHSPFRHHKTKDKSEIDRMTLSVDVKMPESFSLHLSDFLSKLLRKNPQDRLGTKGTQDIKNHPFFKDVDWKQAALQKYIPPLVPPRGEVNAADAFEIGNFDDDETRGIKLTDQDHELYKDFDLVVSSKWQSEICLFTSINQDLDKVVQPKKKSKSKTVDECDAELTDCILYGFISKLCGPFQSSWVKKYVYLYPNRLEWRDQEGSVSLKLNDFLSQKNLVVFECVDSVRLTHVKGFKSIMLVMKDGAKDVFFKCETEPEYSQWSKEIMSACVEAKIMMKKGPKLIASKRSVSEEANYNKAILAAQTRVASSSGINNNHLPTYRHRLVLGTINDQDEK